MAVSYGTYTIMEVQEGSQIWTTTVAPSSPNYTFTISNLTGDSETSIKVGDIIMYSYYRYTVLSISDDGTTVLTGNRVSIRGATGAASVTYTLIVSNLAIIKDKDGNLSPSSITVTAKSQTGSDAMENYTGRIQIETTTDNSTWTSRVNEDASTKIYTIPTDTTAVRCSLYLNGGTTTLLDQQTIPVVSDGVDGTNGINGKDAYTVILTNDNHTFAGDSTHATASEVDCSVIAYKGATQVAATIGSISGQPTGMTTSITDNSTTNAYFTVSVTTSMTAKNGTLTIPITVDGKTFTKKFTYSLALDGVTHGFQHVVYEIHRAEARSLRTNQRTAGLQRLAGQHARMLASKFLVRTKQITYLACTYTYIAGRYVGIRADVTPQLHHKRLAETHYFGVRFAARIEIRTAFAAAHRQGSERVLKRLLEAQELQDAQVH